MWADSVCVSLDTDSPAQTVWLNRSPANQNGLQASVATMRPRASLSGLLKAYDEAKTILDNKKVRFTHKSKSEKECPPGSMETAAERGVLEQQRLGKQGAQRPLSLCGTAWPWGPVCARVCNCGSKASMELPRTGLWQMSQSHSTRQKTLSLAPTS